MEETEEKQIEKITEIPAVSEEKEKVSRFSNFLMSLGIEERKSKVLLFIVFSVVLFSALISFLMMPPFHFTNDRVFTVKKGESLTDVSAELNAQNLIRSMALFEFCAKVVGGTKPVTAGDYLFKEPISACALALRIARGISEIPAITVTLPEGMSNKEMALILAKNLPKFDSIFFIEHARDKEGYLFPDTYNFTSGVVAQGVEAIMNDNFNKKIEPWNGVIDASKHSLHDVVTMASVLEKEATTEEDKMIVAGILWKRIEKGMPLQVDATFMYLLGKKSSDLTSADLQMKSAYNTYRNKGLPGGPIGNPGIIAIRAAIEPSTSPYLYYLSDKNGVMHYARTFEEHKANKEKYLR